ncbi:hypothetical protein C8R45DRAFT_850507, partial [Mycena sanguinolenta]
RVFAILVSVAWYLIWKLRCERISESPDQVHSEKEIHNHWLKRVNMVLTGDPQLTDKNEFGSHAFRKPIVLNTWSGILGNEGSLAEDWLYEGALVVMQPMTDKEGIG